MNFKRLSQPLSMMGLIIIMAAAAMPVFHLPRMAVATVYAIGAALLLCGRLMGLPPRDTPLRLRKMMRLEVWIALIFLAGAVFLFMPLKPGMGSGNDWLAFTLAGGLLTLYTSIMIPRLSRQAEAEKSTGAKKGKKREKN